MCCKRADSYTANCIKQRRKHDIEVACKHEYFSLDGPLSKSCADGREASMPCSWIATVPDAKRAAADAMRATGFGRKRLNRRLHICKSLAAKCSPRGVLQRKNWTDICRAEKCCKQDCQLSVAIHVSR